MTPPNSFRSLASAIVQACQADGAKGVKQSTVLKTLSQHYGYRSIQAAEQQPARTADTLLPTTLHYLHGLLLQSYPDSDFLAIRFAEQAGTPLILEDIRDPLFVHLWNLLISHPHQVMTTLDIWRLATQSIIRVMLKKEVHGDSEQAQQTLNQLATQYPEANVEILIQLLRTELQHARTEGEAIPAQPNGADLVFFHQSRVVSHMAGDLRKVLDAFRDNHIAVKCLTFPDTFLSESQEKDSWLRQR